MLIQKIEFKTPFRCYPRGQTITLKDRVTVIVGDNGAGKSSLLGLLREHFNSPWTPSSLSGRDLKDVIKLTPPVPEKEPLTYIDLANDLLSNRGEMVDAHFDLQIYLMQKSSGQVALLQFSNVMQQSKARVHIIDEPERGLSPAKQWVLAAAIKDAIETRPDDQFLISTHSPQIMEMLGDEVLQLTKGAYVGREDYLAQSEIHGKSLAARYLAGLKEARDQG